MKKALCFLAGFLLMTCFFHKRANNNQLMQDISWCESRNRQWDSDGHVYRGEVNRHDVGIFQINEDHHAVEAAKLGYDIYSLNGNKAFAEYLSKDGVKHWKASYAVCWKNRPAWSSMTLQQKMKAWGKIKNSKQEPGQW